jgi:pimeloyl-ACP methyl ester carboxylesterase
MIRVVGGMLLVALAFYALACVAMYFSQRSLIYYPQPRQSGDGASVFTLPVDGAQLDISTRPMAGPLAVVYFGGNAEDVAGSLPELADAFPAHALYAMHYRAYGNSTGKPTEKALFADALLLFDKVRAQHAGVTIVGRSLGSGVASYVASVRPAARLVLVTPYDSMVGIAARHYPRMPVRLLMSDKFESWRYAPLVAAPTTLIMAEHDEIIPRSSTELLLTRFKPGIAQQIVLRGASHNNLSGPAYTRALSGPPAPASVN